MTYREEKIENLERMKKDLCEKRDEILHETIKQMHDNDLESNEPPSAYYEICDKIRSVSLKLSNIRSQNEEISHLQETALFMEEYPVKFLNAKIEILKKMKQFSGKKSFIDDDVAFLYKKRNYFIKEIDKINKKITAIS